MARVAPSRSRKRDFVALFGAAGLPLPWLIIHHFHGLGLEHEVTAALARLAFLGGVSTQRTLPYGTPDEVKAEARRLMAEIGRGGGYIIAPAHAIPGDVPLENMLALLEAACKAQGMGCAPGILGVGIGGDRATSMIKAKEQLFRPLGDANPDRELDQMEKRLHREINELGIGPMGFGGKTTVLGVKMAQLHRLPASFFVSVAYMCWADRRKIMTIKNGKVTIEAP